MKIMLTDIKNQFLDVTPKDEKIGLSRIISMEMREGIILTKPYAELFPELFSFEKDAVIATLKNTTGRRLTTREVECLSLWVKGFSIKDSAKLLGDLSCRTIQSFRENIKRKLNVETFQQVFSIIQSSGVMGMLTEPNLSA